MHLSDELSRFFIRLPQTMLFVFIFTGIGICQNSIELDQSLRELSLEGKYKLWRSSIFENTSSEQAITEISQGAFTDRSWSSYKPMLTRGNYYYWLFWSFRNNSPDTLEIFVTGDYDPVGVFKLDKGTLEPIPFLGHAASEDPNGLLPTKNRNGFTYRISPGSLDSIIYKIYTPSLRSPFNVVIYNIDHYYAEFMGNLQWPTFLNGAFVGLLVMIFFSSIYFYYKSKEKYMLWYTMYTLLFIIYYWRDFEFWNPFFDQTHQWLTWYHTKVPFGLLIFITYSFFIHDIVGSKAHFPQFDSIQKWIIGGSLIAWVLDLFLLGVYPFGSVMLAYSSAFLIGLLQLFILYPAWIRQKNDIVVNRLVIGTLSLFTGWLTILLFPVQIHQYTIRIFTLIELICFSTAIIEKMIRVFKQNQVMLMERELALMAERDRISAEVHDDLSGSITAIGYLCRLGREEGEEIKKEYFDRIEVLSKQVTQGMTDIIWLMNGHNQELCEFSSYIRSHAQEFLSTQNIDLTFREEIADPEMILPNNLRKDLLLSVKECLHNIQKHSGADQVHICITQFTDSIMIGIRDNGTGMPSRKSILTGNGLINMTKRMRRHNGSMEWEGEIGMQILLRART